MPTRAKKVDRAVSKLPSIPKELVSLFLTGPMTGEAINEAGAAFKKALIEASLNAELSHHLGYEPGADKPKPTTNHRNGSTAKAVLTGDGRLRIETPRDRDGSFEPLLVPKPDEPEPRRLARPTSPAVARPPCAGTPSIGSADFADFADFFRFMVLAPRSRGRLRSICEICGHILLRRWSGRRIRRRRCQEWGGNGLTGPTKGDALT